MRRYYIETATGNRYVAFVPKRSSIAMCYPVSNRIEAAEWDSAMFDTATAAEFRAEKEYHENCIAHGVNVHINTFMDTSDVKNSPVCEEIDSGYHKVGPFSVFVVSGRVAKIWSEDEERVWVYSYSPEHDCWVNQNGIKFSSFKTLVYSDKELKIED